MAREETEGAVRQVLLFSYHFPPNWEVGARRPYALARLLPRHGWRVTVVTVRRPDEAFVDLRGRRPLPRSTRVVRTPSFELARVMRRMYRLLGGAGREMAERARPAGNGAAAGGGALGQRLRDFAYNWVYVPDKRVGWVPYAVAAGLRETRLRRPDVLVTTSPPHSVHLAGYLLARLTGLKWVVDFRDLWTKNTLHAPTSLAKRYAFERWLEERVLVRADRIVTTSQGSRDLLLNTLPSHGWHKVRVIPNGYDRLSAEPDRPSNGAFRLSLTGRLYPGTFEPLLGGLHKAVELEPGLRGKLHLHLMGHLDDTVSPERAGQAGVELQLSEYAHPEQAARVQVGSDLLVCAIPRRPFAEAWLPYKLVEYLGRRKPILFVGPRGEAWDLVRRSRLGWVAEPDDADAIASALLAAYRLRADGRLPSGPGNGFFEEWSVEHRVAQFAALLDEVVGASAANE